MTDTDKRAALIAGLRELADWYVFHPDAPLPTFPEFAHCVMGSDNEAGIAEIQRLGELLGVEPTSDGQSANVDRRFSGVAFHAFYASRERAVAYDEDLKLLAKVKAEQDALAQADYIPCDECEGTGINCPAHRTT